MTTFALGTNTPNSGSIPSFPAGAKAIATPVNDTDTFAAPVAIYVGVTGDVAVRPANGDPAVTFKGVPAGMMLPIEVLGVNLTGTTATNLVAVY